MEKNMRSLNGSHLDVTYITSTYISLVRLLSHGTLNYKEGWEIQAGCVLRRKKTKGFINNCCLWHTRVRANSYLR